MCLVVAYLCYRLVFVLLLLRVFWAAIETETETETLFFFLLLSLLLEAAVEPLPVSEVVEPPVSEAAGRSSFFSLLSPLFHPPNRYVPPLSSSSPLSSSLSSWMFVATIVVFKLFP